MAGYKSSILLTAEFLAYQKAKMAIGTRNRMRVFHGSNMELDARRMNMAGHRIHAPGIEFPTLPLWKSHVFLIVT